MGSVVIVNIGIFQNLLSEDIISYVFKSLIFLFVFSLIYIIITQIVKKIEKKSDHDLINKLRMNVRIPIFSLIFLFSLWLPVVINEYSEKVTSTANHILILLLITLISWILIVTVRLVKYFVLRQYDIGQKDNLKARKVYTQFKIIERVIIFLILIIAVSLALMTFKEIREIGISILASARLAGIILGLAAQKIIGGVLAGIQLAITQPIRFDDVVVVEGEWGRIEEINLTYVVVKIWDERRLVLPTTYFIEKPFQNWTRINSDILGTVFIYTDYTVSVDAIREELTRLLQNTPLWDGKVNVLQVTNSTEKTIEIRALVSAENSGTAWDLRVYIREKLIKFIQEKYPDSLPKSRIVISRQET